MRTSKIVLIVGGDKAEIRVRQIRPHGYKEYTDIDLQLSYVMEMLKQRAVLLLLNKSGVHYIFMWISFLFLSVPESKFSARCPS